MSMKEHILAALQEQFDAWETLLNRLDEAQITAPRSAEWGIKDVIAHLWAWQQISLARMKAAVNHQEPEFPNWVAALHRGWEADANRTNAWVHTTYHPQPWTTIHAQWREGFLQLLEVAKALPEPHLLAWHRYAWLDGPPVVVILLATYDHHQEHLDKVRAWVGEA
ncbi:MAG: ClbS/DfsB family four-helix bundle protein [Anaerolineales bacterium]|nr:ClbS/DfsB family four-helix bundle protein [Anaerolineales bacterium]